MDIKMSTVKLFLVLCGVVYSFNLCSSQVIDFDEEREKLCEAAGIGNRSCTESETILIKKAVQSKQEIENERVRIENERVRAEKAEREAREQRERAKGAEDAKKTVQKELTKFKYPVTIANEIDTFFEIHDWKVNLTAAEEKMIKQIGDQQRKVRVKLVKICEHILSDLNGTDPDIQDLNMQIDSSDNKQLSKVVDPSKRRNVFCNALVWGKVKRNQIHDLIKDVTDLKRYRLFIRETWNECLSIFVNVLTANQGLNETEEELDII